MGVRYMFDRSIIPKLTSQHHRRNRSLFPLSHHRFDCQQIFKLFPYLFTIQNCAVQAASRRSRRWMKTLESSTYIYLRLNGHRYWNFSVKSSIGHLMCVVLLLPCGFFNIKEKRSTHCGEVSLPLQHNRLSLSKVSQTLSHSIWKIRRGNPNKNFL